MSEARPADWKDHFSHASDDYRRWRPRYPSELFEWLATSAPARELAWDCATGNGQAAEGLASCFAAVVATDASEAQIREAEPFDRVEYRIARAEQAPLEDGSVDVITVAQALHWFDIDRFHAEAARVLKPGGVIAEWGYGIADISTEIDRILRRFAGVTVGPYWPPERAMIDTAYAGVTFPFDTIDAPPFAMTARWSLDRFMSYLGTWSSVNGYRRSVGSDPLPEFREKLATLWGDGDREIRWPLILRVGRSRCSATSESRRSPARGSAA
ncbi:MAG TPA: class I SAM-dependent methyltransferase [Candidatus Binatia bacterium]|jgi:ubiquinone/menaquinone biosynthesis C-methylase UbiE